MSKSSALTMSPSKRQALTVWELPQLMQSVHRHRKSAKKPVRERPHFRAILAFVHRNRFTVANQIQRRFSKYLKSDRTARRHLAEMEALGFLGVVDTNGVSPLWPKVYFVTRIGLKRLKEALREKDQAWSESSQDRKRAKGSSAPHVLHELCITEFLLMAWEATQVRGDVQIVTMQRRSLAKHQAFKVVVAGRQTRLQPDAMFLYREQGRGMMCCLVELDLDSMSLKQIESKLRRYEAWAESSIGEAYLKSLYQEHGATRSIATFRLLFVIGSRNRKAETQRLRKLIEVTANCSAPIRDRIWLSTTENLQDPTKQSSIGNERIWVRLRDFAISNQKLTQKAIADAPRHSLFCNSKASEI